MEPKISYTVGDNLIAGVVTAAVMSQAHRPGLWQDTLNALNRGAAKTTEGTAAAFLFQAMVDHLLTEFHTNQK